MVTRGCGVMYEPTRSTQRQCRAKAVWSDSAPRHGSCGKMPPIFSQCAGVTTRPFCVPRGGRAGYVSRVTTGRASELSERRPRTMRAYDDVGGTEFKEFYECKPLSQQTGTN